jgi:hypothetical protein
MIAIVFKVLVAAAAGLMGAWVLRYRGLDTLSESRFVTLALGVQLVPAIGLFLALYVVGHQEPTSDVPAYYVPAARAVLAGQVPFRDFTLSYAPLFPYVGAALLSVWNSGKAFAVFAIVMNTATLLCWHATASTILDRRTAREASVLFAASGHVLIQALLGTNQTWIAAALAASVLLLVRGHSISAGFVQGIALSAVKFLVLLFWPVVWMSAPRRLSWLGGALVLSVAVYGAFAVNSADLLYPLRHEGELISSANLPYLLEPLLGLDSHLAYRAFDGAALLVLGAMTAWLYLTARRAPASATKWLLVPGLVLTQLVFMLVSKKSFTVYALFCMYPLVVVLLLGLTDYRRRVAFFVVFNILLAMESSLWFYLGGDNKVLSAWLHERHDAGVQLFLAVDLALVMGYAYLAWLAVRLLRANRPALSEPQIVTTA